MQGATRVQHFGEVDSIIGTSELLSGLAQQKELTMGAE